MFISGGVFSRFDSHWSLSQRLFAAPYLDPLVVAQ